MLQTYSRAAQPSLPDDRAQAFEPGHLIGILRRRIFYFAIPFVVLLIIGFLIVAIQRPIYQAEGEILVESPEIPTDLVQPTVTAAATERIQVIQQRLMARDSLLPIVEKFNLFPSERQWMSGTQLLDLMRARANIALVDVDMQMAGGKPVPYQNAKNSAVAFTVSFDYENPDLAAKVANELLTSILSEDVRSRTSRATETTEFLAQEVKRLQGTLDAINGQIFAIKQQGTDPKQGDQTVSEQLKMQTDELTAMKADLIQKSSVYSDEFPAIKALKKRIAALEQQIAKSPKAEYRRLRRARTSMRSNNSRNPSRKNWTTKAKSLRRLASAKPWSKISNRSICRLSNSRSCRKSQSNQIDPSFSQCRLPWQPRRVSAPCSWPRCSIEPFGARVNSPALSTVTCWWPFHTLRPAAKLRAENVE